MFTVDNVSYNCAEQYMMAKKSRTVRGFEESGKNNVIKLTAGTESSGKKGQKLRTEDMEQPGKEPCPEGKHGKVQSKS